MRGAGADADPTLKLTTLASNMPLWTTRAAAAIATFVVLGLALGYVFYAWSTPDYPCFLWIVDAETRCGGKARCWKPWGCN